MTARKKPYRLVLSKKELLKMIETITSLETKKTKDGLNSIHIELNKIDKDQLYWDGKINCVFIGSELHKVNKNNLDFP